MKRIILIVLLILSVSLSVRPAEAKSLMAQTITVPLREYTPGTYEVELNTLPGNSEGARILLSRDQVAGLSGVLAHIDVYMSQDNGATWTHVQSGDFSGGELIRNGQVLTHSTMLFTWPGEAGPNGRVMLRGSDVKIIALVFQPFSTEVTIESINSTGR